MSMPTNYKRGQICFFCLVKAKPGNPATQRRVLLPRSDLTARRELLAQCRHRRGCIRLKYAATCQLHQDQPLNCGGHLLRILSPGQ